jgi:ParB/RepB/Spo0J family partition protein
MKILVKNVLPNPYRDLVRNPLSDDQVDKIKDSFERTGYWENVVVRKSPMDSGKYELAHGHNRLEAMRRLKIKEAVFIVKPLGDYEMLAAMIDENATQQSITPKIVMENVTAAIELAEKMLKDSTTVAQFNQALSKSRCASTHNGSWREEEFTKAREAVLDGEGLGRGFIAHFYPGHPPNSHVMQAAIVAHYATENPYSISRDLLEQLPSPSHMGLVQEAASKLKIPKRKHAELVEKCTEEAWVGRGSGTHSVPEEARDWWYKASGKLQNDRLASVDAWMRDKAKRFQDRTIDQFSRDVRSEITHLIKHIEAITGYAEHIQNELLRSSVVSALDDLIGSADVLRLELINVKKEKTVNKKVKMIKSSKS